MDFFFFHHAASALNFLCFNFFISSSSIFFSSPHLHVNYFSHFFFIIFIFPWIHCYNGHSFCLECLFRLERQFSTGQHLGRYIQSTETENSSCSGQKETRFITFIHIEILELITRALILGQKKKYSV